VSNNDLEWGSKASGKAKLSGKLSGADNSAILIKKVTKSFRSLSPQLNIEWHRSK